MEDHAEETHLHLAGMGTFLAIPKLSQALDKVRPVLPVRVHTTHLRYIDNACIELIESWAQRRTTQGGEVHIELEVLHRRFHTPVSRSVV